MKVALLFVIVGLVCFAYLNREATRIFEALLASALTMATALSLSLSSVGESRLFVRNLFYLEREEAYEHVRFAPDHTLPYAMFAERDTTRGDGAWSGISMFAKDEEIGLGKLSMQSTLWSAIGILANEGQWSQTRRKVEPGAPWNASAMIEEDPSRSRGGAAEIVPIAAVIGALDGLYRAENVKIGFNQALEFPPGSKWSLHRDPESGSRPAVLLSVWHPLYFDLRVRVADENPMLVMPEELRGVLASSEEDREALRGRSIRIEIDWSTKRVLAGSPRMAEVVDWLHQVAESLEDALSFERQSERLIEEARIRSLFN